MKSLSFQGYIPRRITCVGYALGGGLATLAAAWAALSIPTADIRCITFGSPRVGNSDFAEMFVNVVSTTYRIIFEADPTTHHPRPLYYSHVGHPIWIHNGNFLFQVRFKGSLSLLGSNIV
jgi:predicted lipase